jgi:hypothetical protein
MLGHPTCPPDTLGQGGTSLGNHIILGKDHVNLVQTTHCFGLDQSQSQGFTRVDQVGPLYLPTLSKNITYCYVPTK